MEHVNGWCFRGIYKGGLWEDDLHVSARIHSRIYALQKERTVFDPQLLKYLQIILRTFRSTYRDPVAQ